MDRIVRIPKTRSGHSLSADIKQDRFRHLHTVFLDRDGVINEKMPEGQYVTRREELRVLPGVGEAIRRLNSRGCRVILVSNQRGIALGLYTAADLEAIHAWLKNFLESHGARLDGIYYCPHDRDECDCRKPMPGMFEQAVRDFPDIDSHSSVIIGDSLSDMEFGRRLGMTCILIQGDPMRTQPGSQQARELADLICPSLADAVNALLDTLTARTTV